MILLERMKQVQAIGGPICPRCGQLTMKPDLHTNAYSRVADIYICDHCGTDEALRDWAQLPLPIEDWFLPQLWKEAER